MQLKGPIVLEASQYHRRCNTPMRLRAVMQSRLVLALWLDWEYDRGSRLWQYLGFMLATILWNSLGGREFQWYTYRLILMITRWGRGWWGCSWPSRCGYSGCWTHCNSTCSLYNSTSSLSLISVFGTSSSGGWWLHRIRWRHTVSWNGRQRNLVSVTCWLLIGDGLSWAVVRPVGMSGIWWNPTGGRQYTI